MSYEDINFKIPKENDNYSRSSDFAIEAIEDIIKMSLTTEKINVKIGDIFGNSTIKIIEVSK